MNTSVFLVGLVLLASGANAAQVSPVQKVVELLEDLKGKVAKDLAAEEAEMKEYTQYCSDESSERGYAIKTATKSIERLNADIEDGNEQASAAQAEIEKMSAEAAQKETELARAMNLRKADRSDFKKTEAELVHAEDELQAAEVLVKREMSFVQVKGKGKEAARKMSPKGLEAITAALSKVIDSAAVNAQSKAKLQGFLQSEESSGDEELHMQPVQPHVEEYENHSGGIVDTIKDLEVKDEEQLSSTRKSEMQEQHSFDMMKMSLQESIDILNKKVSETKAKKSELQEQAAAAQSELGETEKTKAADEAFLKALTTDCKTTAQNWEMRQADAAAEMASIDKAKEILSTGVTVFAQVRAASTKKSRGDEDGDAVAPKEDAQRSKIQVVLSNLGHEYKSVAMMELASRAAGEPFGKVKGLIEDMVNKLMDQAAAEADQKAFCDQELGKSNKAKEDKSRKMDKTQARIDEAASTKASLQEMVKELEGEIAEIDRSQQEATAIRSEEHATYLQASSDYKQSADAVERAMAVLSEYYGKSLIQVKQASVQKKGKQPAFGSKTGGDTASTILSILEVSAEDFTKLLAETEAGEAEADATFQKLSDDNKVSKAAKQAEVRGKESEIKSLTVALAHHHEDYKMVSKEYDAVLAYLDKLKPECETKVMSYAEKKARREKEIEGLKEALQIIDGQSVF